MVGLRGILKKRRDNGADTPMKLKFHWSQISNKVYLGVFAVVLAAAAYFRFWAAPLSTGVDVPQPNDIAHKEPSVLLCAVLQM